MAGLFERLENVIDLEIEQGYQDKAVVGGIRQFAVYWVGKAREEAEGEADRALVEQVSDVLMNYGKLPGKEARVEAIEQLLTSLQKRKTRLGNGQAEQTKPKPKETAKQPKTQSSPAASRVARDSVARRKESRSQIEEAVEPDPQGLAQPVTTVKKVGPKIAGKLQKLGVETVHDLLYLFPRRYDDYTLMKPINKLQYGEQVTIIGTIWQTRAKRSRNNTTIVQSVISDGTGSIQATWFNQPWLVKNLPVGMQIVLSGKVDEFLGRQVFNSPEWEPLDLDPLRTRRIVPVYPLTEGLGSRKLRQIMNTAVSYWAPRVPDPLPDAVIKRQNLLPLPQALQQVHFPESQKALHEATRRLSFDELFLLQLGMQNQRNRWRSKNGIPIDVVPGHLIRFRNALPFTFTQAQRRVIDEILYDLTLDVPMNRLLQGDVGSGKTVVAAAAMVAAASGGAQTAMMAPTEILAEQHYRGLSRLLSPIGFHVELLTGSTSPAEKERIYAGLADGSIPIVIGTHALIQEGVDFDNLALAVIDEQHRFGVDQRGALRQKGVNGQNGQINPHLLVMSATPIPRTLALSLYGDLDLSILDEMPPGRQEIKTRWLRSSERERAYSFIRKQVAEGRQAYIIFPLVEESDKIDAKAAVDEYEVLKEQVFPDLTLGLVHGRLKSEEKESAMRAFYEGDTDILVATSVIEVGVDCPNSTVMVIEGANRFGLAQLHQFRGRVGRGAHQSYCILIADEGTPEAEERLKALEKTNDGFVLAEKDLELRGPGEFFGRRQSGLPELQLASLLDMELLQTARHEAANLFENDPHLERPENQLLREQMSQFWEQAGDLS